MHATPPNYVPQVAAICQQACVAGTHVDISGSGFDPKIKTLNWGMTGPTGVFSPGPLFGQPKPDGTIFFSINGPDMLYQPGDYTVTFDAVKASRSTRVVSVTFTMVAAS